MKITKIEEVQDWMLENTTNCKDIRTIHELALCAIMHHVILEAERYDKIYADKDLKAYTIDGVISEAGLFQDGSLHGVEDDIMCCVNGRLYYYKESYVTKSGHAILVVKEWHDLEDINDHTSIMESEDILFLVEGV